MSIEELEVTLKMLDIKYYFINSQNIRYLYIKSVSRKIKDIIKELLIKYNMSYIIKNPYLDRYCIYIEIREEK